MNCLFKWFNAKVILYAVRPHRADEKLKGFPPSLSFSPQQLLKDQVLKSLITCGAVGREIIAYFVIAAAAMVKQS